ncbi:hypothetical protein Patl1_23995 [Pistacia atlantica]|uniref:Uncharacterized protein n=1 Tax=Pistacia atlantica TaxID=434234 RepID=A0ACC0ZYK7_9ROSI|nr:hypothetical protein Patl1_23995 [Pistacia atlantica]
MIIAYRLNVRSYALQTTCTIGSIAFHLLVVYFDKFPDYTYEILSQFSFL